MLTNYSNISDALKAQAMCALVCSPPDGEQRKLLVPSLDHQSCFSYNPLCLTSFLSQSLGIEVQLVATLKGHFVFGSKLQ